MIQFIFCILHALLFNITIYKYLKVKLSIKSLFIFFLTTLEFYFLDGLILIAVILSTVYIGFVYVDDNQEADVLLFSLLSLFLFFLSQMLHNVFFSRIIGDIAVHYEILVIHLFSVIFSFKYIKNNNNLNENIMYYLCLGLLSITLLAYSLSTLVIDGTQTSHIAFVGSISICIIFYLLIKYYHFFLDNNIVINTFEKKEKKNLFHNINTTKVYNTYNKVNKLNHNLKYILLNIKLFITTSQNDEAVKYIDSYLDVVKSNNSTYTGNSHFDYVMNSFDYALNQNHFTCNKNINILENSEFNEEFYISKIEIFLQDHLTYIKELKPELLSMIIQEKGDFLILKLIYSSIKELNYDLPYEYTYESDILIVQHIIEKNNNSLETNP